MLLQFDYSDVEESIEVEEVKTDPDYGAPRPWNEPKIPMQQVKSTREKLEEVAGTLKVRFSVIKILSYSRIHFCT